MGHTPGPWRAKQWMEGQDHCNLLGGNKGATIIATFHEDRLEHGVSNITLCAAAPELLERFKLEHMHLHSADPFGECLGCKIIKKAEGKS